MASIGWRRTRTSRTTLALLRRRRAVVAMSSVSTRLSERDAEVALGRREVAAETIDRLR